MLKITAEEIHFIIYQYLHESGFEHSSFVFAQEANMHENRFNEYRIPSGMLIVFLEKALTLIHMETHLDDNEEIKECRQPYTLLTPHTCDVTVEQTSRNVQEQERRNMLMQDDSSQQQLQQFGAGQQPATSFMPNGQTFNQAQGFEKQQMMQDSRQDFRMLGAQNPPGLQERYGALPAQMAMMEGPAGFQQYQHQIQHQIMNQFTAGGQQPMMDLAAYQKYNSMQNQYLQPSLPQNQNALYMHQTSSQHKAPEHLEHNPEKGIYFLQAEGDNLEVSSAQFNPKQRLLVAGGNYYLATMWDLRREPNLKYGELQGSLPHVKRHTDTECLELQADVSSVHWSNDGTRLVTSSNDMMARIWQFDEESGHFEIESVKSFNVMLMNSKFNKPPQGDAGQQPYTQLVATGGHSGVVTVWNADTKSAPNKDIAKLVHTQLDPQLEGIEIDWQNSKTLAVTGRSKNIYLWNIDTPQQPVQVWTGGHADEVEQIKWDPSGRLLASCSSENRVCLWQTEKSQPAHIFEDFRDRINQVQWSNTQSGSTLLAAGGQDGFIAIWNVNERQLFYKLPAHERDGGVKCMAFSPNNKMIASGGQDTLCIWQLQDQSQSSLLKHYQKPPHFFSSKISGSVGTTTAGGGIAPNNMSRSNFDSEFSQVSWSHDGILLAAAIHNKILVFDVRKLSQPVVTSAQQQPKQPVPVQAASSAYGRT